MAVAASAAADGRVMDYSNGMEKEKREGRKEGRLIHKDIRNV